MQKPQHKLEAELVTVLWPHPHLVLDDIVQVLNRVAAANIIATKFDIIFLVNHRND